MIATVTLNPSLDEWIELPAVRLGALNRARSFTRYAGGKGINVSRVVHELGGRTRAYTLLGGDDGEILRAHLRRLGIPVCAVEVPGATRNNYKILTADPPGVTEINAPGPRVRPAAVAALRRRLLAQRPRPRYAALSGSLPPGAPAAAYQTWTARLRRAGIRALVDASGEVLRRALRARPWAIKPNRAEAEELLDRPLATLAAAVDGARALQARGPGVVILSLGADGAVLATAAGVWAAHPPQVPVRSAVGAGDSLVAGFLLACDRGAAVTEALRLGSACGAATAMTSGTELCHRRDVARLLPRVRLRRLA
jgi:1-phosphofructokinase family hexose kinase